MTVYNSKSKDWTDIYFTPIYAIKPLFQFISKDWIVWEPAVGNGAIANYLARQGLQVFGTDINKGYDFLTYAPTHINCIITNPPFSLKTEFLERAFTLDLPFALLVPCDTLVSKRRFKSFKDKKIQLIIPNKRIVFDRIDGGKSCPNVSTMWLTYKFNLPSDIIFVEI
jgi:hypothetical protein